MYYKKDAFFTEKYGEIRRDAEYQVRNTKYSVRMWENTD